LRIRQKCKWKSNSASVDSSRSRTLAIRLSSTGSYRKRILRASIQDVVDFLAPDLFIGVAEVQPDETDEFLHLPGAAASFK